MMQGNKSIFVFVVCGGKEHIDTLHFSLHALQKYSTKEICVVTDSSRNEIPVIHHTIVDIPTPKEFNHHQASIYLKTGLHKFLPKGNNYCYLDTDVVALNNSVDSIFEKFTAPITFCTDHCSMDEFSPLAIFCNCYENFVTDTPKPAYYFKDFHQNVLPQLKYIDDCITEIEQLVNKTKKNRLLHYWHFLKYWLPGRYYRLNEKFKMNKRSGKWLDSNQTPLFYKANAKDYVTYVNDKTGFVYDHEKKEWFRQDGSSIIHLRCSHLKQKLEEKFNIKILTNDWQHWNGGVFVFNDDSAAFLEQWHNSTMAIFKDSQWRTRDQGTLIATVWQYNLQQHPTLPLEYNLIADYNNESIEYIDHLSFRIGPNKKTIQPHFIHIYHHWGDEQWPVWNDVVKHIAAT
ncbi:MAG: hypothetical protein KA242_05150 [Chitinophagales bacterium]|nr:hypothetical protein [Chitinophagales bacterium]